MTNTENYELNKPDASDFYDVEKFNENMDIIDSELKENKSYTDNEITKLRGGCERTLADVQESANEKLPLGNIGWVESFINITLSDESEITFFCKYPDGFTKENTAVISAMIKYNDGLWHTVYLVENSTKDDFNPTLCPIIELQDKIAIRVRGTSSAKVEEYIYYRIVLLRLD